MDKTYEQWCEDLQKAIDNPTDAATVISVLTAARDDVQQLYAENAAQAEDITRLTGDNTRLTDTNRELFLRIGQTLSIPAGQGQEMGQDGGKQRGETITIDDLFKEDN